MSRISVHTHRAFFLSIYMHYIVLLITKMYPLNKLFFLCLPLIYLCVTKFYFPEYGMSLREAFNSVKSASWFRNFRLIIYSYVEDGL